MLPGTAKPRFNLVDAVVLAALATLAVYVFYQLSTVMNYRWKWAALPRFVLRWDDETEAWVPNLLLLGFFTTLRLSVWGSLVALVAGTAIGLLRVVPSQTMRLLGGTYVALIRNVPPLVFLFVFYFFLSSQLIPLTGIEPAMRRADPAVLAVVGFFFGEPRQIGSFLSTVVALGLFAAAFIAEIVRAGIEAVGKGQLEAAQALGLSWAGAMRLVVVPQALARVWSPLANQLILLVKFSSLASLLSVPDLTFQANQVGITTRSMFEVWIVVGGIYFVICYGLAALFGHLERRSAGVARR